MPLWEKLKCTSGFLGLKIVTCRLLTNLVLDVDQLPKSTKMLQNLSVCAHKLLTDNWINRPNLWVILYLGSVNFNPRFDNETSCCQFVPRSLADNQKEHRDETCCFAQNLQLETDPYFLSKLMNHGAILTTQKHSKSKANGRRQVIVTPSKKMSNQNNSDLLYLMSRVQFIQSCFLRSGCQSNLKTFKNLCNSVLKKRPDLWQAGDWFFHHDNGPCTNGHLCCGMVALPHTPYSPCNFSYFHT